MAEVSYLGAEKSRRLRHTYASLRCACGDPVADTAEQIGHTDPRFTLRVYTHALKHRQRLSPAERNQYDLALEWAQMGTNEVEAAPPLSVMETARAAFPRLS